MFGLKHPSLSWNEYIYTLVLIIKKNICPANVQGKGGEKNIENVTQLGKLSTFRF